MAQVGGKGRLGIWFVAFRDRRKTSPDQHKPAPWQAGVMLDRDPSFGWLFTFGCDGLGTLGFGWVRKHRRQHDSDKPHEHP